MAVSPIPKGYHSITGQLSIDGAAHAIAFYEKAFGAEVISRSPDPSGQKLWHAVLRVGDSMLMVNDVFPEMGGTPSHSSFWLYVADVDAAWKRAVDAGLTVKQPPSDMFWGDRMGHGADPFGQTWTLATRTRDMTPDEINAAQAAFLASMQGKH